jgi:hypothetical protein
MKYAKGDRLWVRETVACGASSFWRREQGSPNNHNGLWYAADGLSPASPITERGRWVPSIHMPRWASRLTLIVTGTKVERLWSLSTADERAEGFRNDDLKFSEFWGELHGAGAWDKNPEVEVVSFRVIRANIDAPEARLTA